MATVYKLIVNKPDGIQEIIQVFEGGKYYDDAKVIYDEQVSGPLTQDQIDKVGGWTLVNDKLTFDQALFDNNTALVLAKAKKEKLSLLEKKAEEAIESHAPIFKQMRFAFELATGLTGDGKDTYDMLKAHYAKYDQLKAQIQAAKDLAQLEAVIIDFSNVTW